LAGLRSAALRQRLHSICFIASDSLVLSYKLRFPMTTKLEQSAEPFSPPSRWVCRQRAFVLSLLGIVFLVSGFITFATWHQPHKRAVIGMAWGLIMFWIIGCGFVMWRCSAHAAGALAHRLFEL
jgi:hypothetical protein